MILSFFHLPFYLTSSYYRNDRVNPQYGAVPALVLVLAAQEFCLYIVIRILQNPYFYGIGFSSSYALLITFVNCVLAYFIYIKDGKPLKVYQHYQDKPWANTRLARVLGWLYVLLSILSPFLLAIARNAAIGRHLV
ncbi:hypothetical protein CA264_15015 [Pontibacter actiniarum]|uniref:Uncharacterized protein n=1 Tax=Pontibacter actiniarum TaxID=323450 RepID=A0A1X9YUV2_9BACT|nr:hypothetical protein CA264_15015 [Pontibacter actiniarum]